MVSDFDFLEKYIYHYQIFCNLSSDSNSKEYIQNCYHVLGKLIELRKKKIGQ